jgi:hypothetical protein
VGENSRYLGPAVTIAIALCGALAVWVASADSRHDEVIKLVEHRLQESEKILYANVELVKAQAERLDALNRFIEKQIADLDARLQREFISLSNVGIATTTELKNTMIREHTDVDQRLKALEKK